MFESMEFSESVYEGVVKPTHKNPTRADVNRADHSRKMRRETVLSNTYSNMSERDGKGRKICRSYK